MSDVLRRDACAGRIGHVQAMATAWATQCRPIANCLKPFAHSRHVEGERQDHAGRRTRTSTWTRTRTACGNQDGETVGLSAAVRGGTTTTRRTIQACRRPAQQACRPATAARIRNPIDGCPRRLGLPIADQAADRQRRCDTSGWFEPWATPSGCWTWTATTTRTTFELQLRQRPRSGTPYAVRERQHDGPGQAGLRRPDRPGSRRDLESERRPWQGGVTGSSFGDWTQEPARDHRSR